MQEDIQMYSCSSIDEKIQTNLGSDSYECTTISKCLFEMVYAYGLILMVLHLENTMEIVWLALCYFPKVFLITYINSHFVNGHQNLVIGLYVLTSNVCICLIVRRPLKLINNWTSAWTLSECPCIPRWLRICYRWQGYNMVPHKNANGKLSRKIFSCTNKFAYRPSTYLGNASRNVVLRKKGLIENAMTLECALLFWI